MLCIHSHYGLPPRTYKPFTIVCWPQCHHKRMTGQTLRRNQSLNTTLLQHKVLAQITGLSVTGICFQCHFSTSHLSLHLDCSTWASLTVVHHGDGTFTPDLAQATVTAVTTVDLQHSTTTHANHTYSEHWRTINHGPKHQLTNSVTKKQKGTHLNSCRTFR